MDSLNTRGSLCVGARNVIGTLSTDGYTTHMTNTTWVLVWTPEEMAQIVHRARGIEADPQLRVNTDDTSTRVPTGEEHAFLSSASDIMRGHIWEKMGDDNDEPCCLICERSISYYGAHCQYCADFD